MKKFLVSTITLVASLVMSIGVAIELLFPLEKLLHIQTTVFFFIGGHEILLLAVTFFVSFVSLLVLANEFYLKKLK